jgi:hypothetical protein
MPKKVTQQEFIEKAKLVHGNKYDYSLVNYINSQTKIKIICPEHGVFEQRSSNHLLGIGCSECGKISENFKRRLNTKEFIEKAKKIHGDKYDYSLVNYITNVIKVKIICSEHGEFEQTPCSHLSGNGCRKCGSKLKAFNYSKDQQKFIQEANKIHNNKYDYSLINYINSKTKIKIICPKHGIFEQGPSNHLQGSNCPECSKIRNARSNTKEFINRANKIHNNKYDYSKAVYVKSINKIKIICPKHGEFEQNPSSHLAGKGCPKCKAELTTINLSKSTQKFIQEANLVHNNKYDYSETNYINNRIKVKIICHKHGEFEQNPKAHLNGSECPKCVFIVRGLNKRLDVNEFIGRANQVHNNKYNYSKVNYIGVNNKVIIICPEHGEFIQSPNNHLKERGCPKCNGGIPLTQQIFINRSNKIHNNKYDYSETIYTKVINKVKIICPIHGEFIQSANDHINGKGCPRCNESKGEKAINNFLTEQNIQFNPQYRFKDCKDKKTLPFDFYLPNYNICIEYQGQQHYKPIERFGGKEQLKYVQKHDRIKRKYCKDNNIKLIRIKYTDNTIKVLQDNLKEILNGRVFKTDTR